MSSARLTRYEDVDVEEHRLFEGERLRMGGGKVDRRCHAEPFLLYVLTGNVQHSCASSLSRTTSTRSVGTDNAHVACFTLTCRFSRLVRAP